MYDASKYDFRCSFLIFSQRLERLIWSARYETLAAVICFVPGMIYVDDAVEAWRSLLRAACAESVPPDVYFALGNLHYVWGELLEFGKRAELGAEVRVCRSGQTWRSS